MNTNLQYEAYEIEIGNLLTKYIALYNSEFPGEKNFDTAKNFMDKYYDKYRKEVAAIGVDAMHKSGMNPVLCNKIIQQNAYSIGALFEKIMKISIGLEGQ